MDWLQEDLSDTDYNNDLRNKEWKRMEDEYYKVNQ